MADLKKSQDIEPLVVTRQRLVGKVRVSGAKNSALKLLAASILTEAKIELSNSPNSLSDMVIHTEMLEALGKRCQVVSDQIIILEPMPLKAELIWEGRSIRNTLLILGAMVSRLGAGKVPLPGGCPLGERKHDLHVMLLQAMGAEVWEEDGYLCAESQGGLRGADIRLPFRSTGATENAIICGCLAKGITTVWNPHVRPEVLDLIALLNKMGARITVFGQQRIEIEGVDALHGASHDVLPDNMEALTWAIASAITDGYIEIERFPTKHLEVPLAFLRESGLRYFLGEDSLIVSGGRPSPIDISTGPYPGINSDMQPLFAVFGACSEGASRIIDLRFPGRYDYFSQLKKMGVKGKVVGDFLHIDGGSPLMGCDVVATDLRAGIALVLAGLIAEGETRIHDAWQIDRGYEHLDRKLSQLRQNSFS